MLGREGGTIVESMVAFAILAGAAVAIYPVFLSAQRTLKYGDIKQTCENVVRGKLDEYRFGKMVSLSTEALSTNPVVGGTLEKLGKLSLPTIAESSLTDLRSGGFQYAKIRYNKYFPIVCSGIATPVNVVLDSPSTAVDDADDELGMRECVGDGTAWDDQNPPTANYTCTTDVDSRIRTQLQNFKLYVKLELDTPWSNMVSDLGGRASQYSVTCPRELVSGVTGDNQLYDFGGSSDGLRVTVTGLLDITDAQMREKSMGVAEARQLKCSASSVVRPSGFPVRYYLGKTGRIYSVQGRGLNRDDTQWEFRSLYTQGAMLASGIIGFAVHPRNYAIYVLRVGSLTRYSDCRDYPIDCSNDPVSGAGISDLGDATGWNSVQEWSISPGVRAIAVDFRSGAVFAMSGNKQEFYRVTYGGGKLLRECEGNACGAAELNTVADGTFPRPTATGTLPNRLTGFFISPEGSEAFVSDLASQASLENSAYNASIYRVDDISLLSPLITMPVSAVSFSL